MVIAQKKILLVDGNNLLFRAFYANQWLKTGSQFTTKGAIYGFAKMLNGFLSKNDYFDVVVAFDKNRKTFRHQIFPQYKAHRKTLPPELLAQFDPVRQFLKISGITFFELDDYEADDILMSLAKLAVAQGYWVDILSGDRDLLQALIMDVRVLMPEKGLTLVNTITPDDFLQKYCFRPVFFPDYKALMGDSSDNFLGVKGIGPVMAKKLITRYGDLKSIYLEIEALSPKIQQLLLNQKEQVFFFKKLAVLIDDIKFDYRFTTLVLDKNAQNDFFKKYHFWSLIWPN